MHAIADDESIDAAGFASFVARGDAWVTVDDDGSVVAYLLRPGWTELPKSRWGSALARRVAAEAAHGLSAWPRVVMFRRIDVR